MSANDGDTARALCGQWMPRKKTKGGITPQRVGNSAVCG
jgi:hypothetical protein